MTRERACAGTKSSTVRGRRASWYRLATGSLNRFMVGIDSPNARVNPAITAISTEKRETLLDSLPPRS